jgi:hypothetical protein
MVAFMFVNQKSLIISKMGKKTISERGQLENLVKDKELDLFKHPG